MMNNYGINGSEDGDGDRWTTGRDRERGTWKQSSQEPHLRRPHQTSTGSQAPLGSQAQGQTESDILKKSTLSPDAKEFIPSSQLQNPMMTDSQPIPVRHSVQSRFETARLSIPSSEQPQYMFQHQQHQHIPQHNYYQDNQHFYQYDPQTHSDSHYNNICSNDHNSMNQRQFRKANDQYVIDLNVTINQLEASMRTLTLSPGEFDRLVSHLVDIISPFLEDTSQCQEIITVIINQSVTEGNFRYNGARLCTHLDTVATPPEGRTSNFRKILLQKCQEQTQIQGNDWQQKTVQSDEDEKRCHGLILFLAELVTQMHSSAPTLGKMLLQLISTVLQKPAPTSAKNICQALKLAGQTLERDNAGGRKDMEAVMRQLTNLVIECRVDSHVGRMVNSVSELRSNSWGRAVPNITPTYRPPSVDSNVSSRSQQSLDEPVLYGPDGKVISTEESEFLQSLTKDTKDSDELSDDFHDSDIHDFGGEDEEEDDVIAAAYEEFLKLSENSSNQIKHQ